MRVSTQRAVASPRHRIFGVPHRARNESGPRDGCNRPRGPEPPVERNSTVIYRHHIAPSRAFSQFSHDLIRHPRLSSDAVRLLTWQLSLPDGARESLSRTAERARIGACAFTRAKRQLKEEGFVHERRLQGPGGHWVTQQLVSNVPLSAAEATKILARMPAHTPSADASPQVVPSPRIPAVGVPTPPLTDGHPRQDPWENTSHHPAEPERQPDPAPQPEPAPETSETPEPPKPPAPSSPPSPASPPTCAASPGHARRTGPPRLPLARGRSHSHRRPHAHPARPPRRRHPGPPPRRPPALPPPRRATRAGPRRHPGPRTARPRTSVQPPRRPPRMRGRPRTSDPLPPDRRRNPLPPLPRLIAVPDRPPSATWRGAGRKGLLRARQPGRLTLTS